MYFCAILESENNSLFGATPITEELNFTNKRYFLYIRHRIKYRFDIPTNVVAEKHKKFY